MIIIYKKNKHYKKKKKLYNVYNNILIVKNGLKIKNI